MNIRFAAITILFSAAAAAQQTPPCAGLPPGKHALLERLTAQFGLTCEQELKIEPLLHDEESVTKPLLKFSSLSPEEKQNMMLTIKLAARRQVRSELTAEQQKDMDKEVESVSKAAADHKPGGKKATAKNEEPASGIAGEETLSKAIVKYSALTPEEKNAMLLKVKEAARNDSTLQLTEEQQKTLDTEIQQLKK